MLIDEVDKNLDMECTIHIKSNKKIFQYSTFERSPIPVCLTIGNGQVEDLFYLSDVNEEDRELKMFLSESKSVRSGDLWIFKIKSQEYDPLKLYAELVSIPSVVINYKILLAKTHIVNFRFDSSELDLITKFLVDATDAFENFEIVYLGKSAGLKSIYSKLNKILPLYYLSVRLHVPDTDIGLVSRSSIKWTREQKFKSTDNSYYSVYYFDGSVDQPEGILTEIDAKKGLYFRKSSSKLMVQYLQEFLAKSYPSFMEIQSFSDHHITIETIVSRGVVKQHLLTLKNIFERFSGWKIEIRSVVPFDII
ncbi:hypothetical protein OXIME_000709 [Oxyplasma meridianum]|uniref:Uncharacterized protein n=1 Tax=Oxyplasma meridianum TaxID=3073602 RepID=A0AAX4NG69_9ARCH